MGLFAKNHKRHCNLVLWRVDVKKMIHASIFKQNFVAMT
ncbi:hypothetical protein OH685_04590 [Acinetobacter pittii]|nr:hypothetical protein OH685_04590 [Acinetobacter pittii]